MSSELPVVGDLHALITGEDAVFDAQISECLDEIFDRTKRWTQDPRLQRIAVESLIASAREHERRAERGRRESDPRRDKKSVTGLGPRNADVAGATPGRDKNG